MKNIYTADFETTTDEEDCRVWAYAICEIGNPDNFIYGNNIDDFIKWCMNPKKNYKIWFHNLKFDGEYIISWLLNHGYTWIQDKKDKENKTFTTLITDMGQFFSIEIFFETKGHHVNKVTFYDSLKILNFSVEKIAKSFDLPIQKLEIDYNEQREIGHILTNEEIAYIRNDVEIMARALKIMFDKGLTKMTIASDALSDYKKTNKNFHRYFPMLEYGIDEQIRKSYKGGFTYLNPLYKEKETAKGLVLDVNSLYPSVMYNEKLPFGNPIYFKGKYEDDSLYNLYIQKISCSFKLKDNMIPTIQIKNNMSFIPNEYVESSKDEIVTLTLTNIDLELFLKHYDVYDLTYHEGFKFKSARGLFTTYIDKWTSEKIKAKKEGNSAQYQISKLMLNSLYGKFGLNPNAKVKMPYLDEEGIVSYKIINEGVRDTIYIPIATFITSYARKKTIETSQKIREYTINNYQKDYYIYSDTDSIHMLYMPDDELKQFIEIDDFKLGAWKHESDFIKGKFIRQKCYIEQEQEEIKVTIAGLPKKLSHKVNFTNFKPQFTTSGKLTFKHVKGRCYIS